MPSETDNITELLIHTMGQLQTEEMPLVVTNMGSMDNEEVTQILLTTVKRIETMVSQETMWTALQKTFMSLSYSLIVEQCSRDDLKTIVYYARITPDGILRCPAHPFRLMEYTHHREFPDAYNFLFYNQVYLRNVVSVYDPNPTSNTVTLLRLQQVRFHTGPPTISSDAKK